MSDAPTPRWRIERRPAEVRGGAWRPVARAATLAEAREEFSAPAPPLAPGDVVRIVPPPGAGDPEHWFLPPDGSASRRLRPLRHAPWSPFHEPAAAPIGTDWVAAWEGGGDGAAMIALLRDGSAGLGPRPLVALGAALFEARPRRPPADPRVGEAAAAARAWLRDGTPRPDGLHEALWQRYEATDDPDPREVAARSLLAMLGAAQAGDAPRALRELARVAAEVRAAWERGGAPPGPHPRSRAALARLVRAHLPLPVVLDVFAALPPPPGGS